MKILAFSDLHCDQEIARQIVQASHEADIVVGAGDFGTRCVGASDTISILREIAVPTIVLPGNHDSLEDLQSLCLDRKNCHVLHGESVLINGVAFFGLGYEIPRRSAEKWNQTLSEAAAADLLTLCPENAVIVTHTPPLGHCDLQRDGSHEGSASIRDAIKLKNIKLNLCGHIHYSWGKTAVFNDCAIHNLGPTLNWFDI